MSLTIGVDVGGTKVAAGAVDERGKIVEKVKRATPAARPDGQAGTESRACPVRTGLIAIYRCSPKNRIAVLMLSSRPARYGSKWPPGTILSCLGWSACS